MGGAGGRADVHPGAEEAFGRAIDTARRQGARWLELRALVGLSRLQREDGRQDARSALADLYDGFAEGLDTRDLRDAKAMLER